MTPRTAVSGKAAPTDAASRQRMADKGTAMPDRSFPIGNRAQLQDAVQALGRAKNPDAVKRHIVKRARALGALAWLKEHTSWYDGPTS